MNLSEMSLEQKIGQMFFAGFSGDTYGGSLKKAIEEYHIGNVILFERNITDIQHLTTLNRTIQEKSLEYLKIPAFIAVDQEGGMVVRIKEGATYMPGNMAFSAANEDTYRAGVIMGKELRALGINMNLAPCLDINSNPQNPVIGVRSYGEEKEKVAALGIGYIEGLQKYVAAVAKHFPGHGDTITDSHLDLPVIHHDVDRIREMELYPFKAAIKAGVDAIMTAHVLFPAFEQKKLPATLSYRIMTGLLRKQLSFEGLIVSDCMEMSAIKDYYGTAQAVIKGIEAGVDMFFISHHLEYQIESVQLVKKAVLEGALQESRINQSVEKILSIKEKYNLFDNPFPNEEKIKDEVGCQEHRAFAKSVSQKSITVLEDRLQLIPLQNDNVLFIGTEPTALVRINMQKSNICCFSDYMKQHIGRYSETISTDPGIEEIESILDKIKQKDPEVVVIGTYNGHLNQGQMQLVKKVEEIHSKVIVVALRNPYDFKDLKGSKTTKVCAYEYTPLSLDSVCSLLKGDISAQGKLPVSF